NGIPSMIRCNASVQKALHVIFCLCDSLGICYGQVATDEKESEITAIPDLLEHLSVKGYLL
ncbi:hypothetical protein SMU50_07516, partial [Streptococcus mutans 5SM3]